MLSKFLASRLLQWIFDDVDMPLSDDEVYMTLHTADPEGEGLHEVADTSYVRLNVFGAFAVSGGGTSVTNSIDILWPIADGNFIVTHVGLTRSQSGGTGDDFIAEQVLPAPVAVVPGKQFKIPAGLMTVDLRPPAV